MIGGGKTVVRSSGKRETMPSPFEIKSITLSSATWTALVTPWDCSSINIKNADPTNTIKIRTNQADPNTQDTVGPSIQYTIAMPFHRYRFPSGATVLFMQTTAGTGPAVVSFLA